MELDNIQEELNRNPDIQPKIKSMVKEVFSDMYQYLGERGFKKWLLDNRFNSVARRVIVRVLTAEKDEFLQGHPNTAGYHIIEYDKYTGEPKNKIVLKRKIGDNKHVLAHETFHAFVDGLGKFEPFIGEGITEYLTLSMYGGSNYAYRKNVQVVDLLAAMYGDRIFKYYFTKQGYAFFGDLEKEISGKSQSFMYKNDSEIMTKLASFHEVYYYRSGSDKEGNEGKNNAEELKKANQDFRDALDALLRNYYLYKKDQISKFRYIHNGQVDFDEFIKDSIRVYYAYNGIDGRGTNEYINSINEELTKQLIDNSHLLVGLDEDIQAKVKESIKGRILQEIALKGFKYERSGQLPDVIIDQQEEPFRTLNANAKEKLMQRFVIDKDDNNLCNKIEVINNIALATGMSQEEIDDAIKRANTDRISCDSKEIQGIVDRYSTAYRGLQAVSLEADENIENRKYIPMSFECLSQSRAYLEVTDESKFAILLADRNTGKVDRVKLDKYGGIFPEEGIVVRLCNNKDKDEYEKLPADVRDSDNVFQVYNMQSKESSYIGLPEDFAGQGIHPEKITVSKGDTSRRVWSISGVKEDVLSGIVLDDLSAKIEDGKYSSNKFGRSEGEREDFNPRYIYYDNFVEDYVAQIKTFGLEETYNRDKLNDLSGDLIDRTFEIDKLPETKPGQKNESIKFLYSSKRYKLIDEIAEFASAKMQDKDEETIMGMRGEINRTIFDINQGVKALVQDRSSTQGKQKQTPNSEEIGYTISEQTEPVQSQMLEQQGKNKSQPVQSEAEARDSEYSGILQSAIRATEKRTRNGVIQTQIQEMARIKSDTRENVSTSLEDRE